MRAKVVVKAEKIYDNLKRARDLRQDYAPLFLKLLGEDNDMDARTLKGGFLRTWATKTSPRGESWDPLSTDYLKRKVKAIGQKPTLVYSGELFDSLVRKGKYQLLALQPKKLSFGTIAPYASFLNEGTAKMPQREFMGLRKEQVEFIKKSLAKYLSAVMRGEK